MDAARANSWTVLIYTSASHDLEKAVTQSLEEITRQGTPQDVRVVAQMGSQGSVQRYQLHQVVQPRPLGERRPADMTEPEELQRFLGWGMEKYPAEHYAIVLGGHGAGFAGAVTDSQRRRMISLPDLEKGLGELPRRPDLVVFNTCLMAQAEVASQLHTVSDHLVASQSELRGLGLPLATWLQQLPNLAGGSQAAAQLVQASEGLSERAPAVASIDLRRWPQLQSSLDELAGRILDAPGSAPRLRQHIQQQPDLWPHAQDRPLVDQIDLAGLCRAWQNDRQLPEDLRRQAGQVGLLVSQLCRSSQETGGLSAYLPDQSNGPFIDQIYARLRFARETRWDEALQSLSSGLLDH
ncbi:MAG: hypothetical protein KF760_07360 [Candidatus Eremiobacteraeota bacterium]|nr:hypothetical protein [Candidatus Eremiobacteraeota bacterium]MCW5870825.1 hypothetical protein [Candidatus Eremiobacteraeota bacterium]